MAAHVFVGFGFGPIQGGLFAKEAFESGNFSRIVVAEIDRALVDAVRSNGGTYYVNVARSDGIEVLKIDGVELFEPGRSEDLDLLAAVLTEATEMATCLPSVDFYDRGDNSIACLIAQGLKQSTAKATIVYAAENHNHAAEILQESVARHVFKDTAGRVQFLNTVIGKMSRVVADSAEIAARGLTPIAPGIGRAFLVEQFNRILVGRTTIGDLRPGIGVFVEKDDLLPFEQAKLYGHNAVHTLLAFIGMFKGYARMTELADDKTVMEIAGRAFLDESGAALVRKYGQLRDELFTEAGFRAYAEDLLTRITNPYLGDTVARAGRDPVRKLGLNDRIFGAMNLALEYGIEPRNLALGAAAGIAVLVRQSRQHNLPADLRVDDWRVLDLTGIEAILAWVWGRSKARYSQRLVARTHNAMQQLIDLVGR